MDEKDIQVLIDAFIRYRELLTPINDNLNSFITTYETIRGDIDKLNNSINGEVGENLEKIYHSLATQANKASDLASRIDQFMQMSNRYISGVNATFNLFDKIEKQVNSINNIEDKANEQLEKLDKLLEEKKKSYNVKDLERALENYNGNVVKVGEFINKDIASALYDNKEKMQNIRIGSEKLTELVESENENIEKLILEYQTNSKFLETIVQNEQVNEEYLFDILDKWAITRKVKIRK